MNRQTYLKVCAGVAVLTVLVVLFVPGASDLVEGSTLLFLSQNATTPP